MESLLIVDDEVIIADGLYHMLQEVFQDRLEVRRCYSCDEACSLLSETDQSIASIAEQTGFNTANYFARWFRKWMGCTAQEYRERSRDHLYLSPL